MMRPIIFLDIDDVLATSREFTSYQVIASFKSGDLDGWPELWEGLIFAEARTNLAALHAEFWPQYVVSSSWSNYLTRKQMQDVFRRTGLPFVADNMHKSWTTPKGTGSARLNEIENWIAQHGQASRPMLVLDDHESGWGLRDSRLEDNGYVVLCEPWVGLVAEKLAEAQRLFRAQMRKVTEPVPVPQLTNSSITTTGEFRPFRGLPITPEQDAEIRSYIARCEADGQPLGTQALDCLIDALLYPTPPREEIVFCVEYAQYLANRSRNRDETLGCYAQEWHSLMTVGLTQAEWRWILREAAKIIANDNK